MSRRLKALSIVLIAAGAVLQRAPVAAVPPITAQDMSDQIAAIQGPRYAFGTPSESAKLTSVTAYIRDRLAGFGLNVHEEPVTLSGQTFPNVVGTLPGSVCPDKSFIVGAHYDSVSGSPGADDDGSGVAGMLEAARVLSTQPFQASVEFVGFSFEEQGLVGSRLMASQAQAAGKQILGMFSLEMIGYYSDAPGSQTYPPGMPPPPGASDRGNFIAVVGNTASHALLQSFAQSSASAVPGLLVATLEVPGNGEGLDARRSDHAPFWDAGYQALLVTDTANFRNPNYHTPSDTLDTLDAGFAANVANAAVATVSDMLTRNADAANTSVNRPGTDSTTNACDSDDDGDAYSDVAEAALGEDAAAFCAIMRADVDGDQIVSILDLSQVAMSYGQAVPPAPDRLTQDADNVISILDLSRQAGVYLQPVSACP